MDDNKIDTKTSYSSVLSKKNVTIVEEDRIIPVGSKGVIVEYRPIDNFFSVLFEDDTLVTFDKWTEEEFNKLFNVQSGIYIYI